jgi:hypothetical protein
VKRTIPTIPGIIIILLAAALIYSIYEWKLWEAKVKQGGEIQPSEMMSGVKPEAETLVPSPVPPTERAAPAAPRPGTGTLPMPGPGAKPGPRVPPPLPTPPPPG